MAKVQEILNDAESRMRNTIDGTKKEYAHLRAGRATASLIDWIQVDAYETTMALSHVATIGVPDAKTLVITPYDRSQLVNIEKAIHRSEIGLNPQNDGSLIRITVPPLSEERRKELVKIVNRMAEECRVAIRNIRRDANESLKKMEKNKELSEDDLHKHLEESQKRTDKMISEVDRLVEEKIKEIMSV